MKKKEMNSVYGKCAMLDMKGQYVTTIALHESIYLDHLRGIDAELCLNEILESFLLTGWLKN